MERQPYYQPAESGNKDSSSKDKKTSGGFNIAPGPAFQPVEHAPAQPPVERRQSIPIAPAFEGVISWREKADEMLHESEVRSQAEQAPERIEPEANKDTSKEKDGKDTPKKQAVQQPLRPEAIPAPRPLAEIITDDKQLVGAESSAEEDMVQDQEQPLAPGMIEVPQPFGDFPPVEGRPVETSEADATPPVQAVQPSYAFRPPAKEQRPVVAAPHVYEGAPETADADPYATPPSQPLPAAFSPQPATYNQVSNQAANANVAPFGPLPTSSAAPNYAPASPNLPPTGGNGGNMPPSQPGYGFNNDPFGPYGPAYSAAESAPTSSHNSAPAMPIERPAMPTSNRDSRVGGVAALLGLEYFARKRADRKLEKRVNKRHDEQFKKHEEQMAADQRRLQEQQKQFAAEQERQGREMHRMQYREVAPQSVSDALKSTTNLPQTFEAAPSAYGRPERMAAAPVQPYAPEARPMPVSQERQPMGPSAQEAAQRRPQPNPEQLAEAADDRTDIKLQPHQHIEHSAWHNIVVDEKGHEVAGAIQYGEGFKRERQHEAIRDRTTDGGQAGAASQATGGGFAQDEYGMPMLPSGMTTPSLPQGHSTHVDPQHQLPAHNKQQSNITNPWFWIMLLLIIAAFFTAALV